MIISEFENYADKSRDIGFNPGSVSMKNEEFCIFKIHLCELKISIRLQNGRIRLFTQKYMIENWFFMFYSNTTKSIRAFHCKNLLELVKKVDYELWKMADGSQKRWKFDEREKAAKQNEGKRQN